MNFTSAQIPQDAMTPLRKKAWSRFEQLGLPSKEQEAFRYLPLSGLYASEFVKSDMRELPTKPKATLVFVDGILDISLSQLELLPPDVVILPLADAMRSYGAFLQQRLAQTLQEDSNPFTALNTALHPQGSFIFIPPHVQISTPIECVHVLTEARVFPRLHLVMGSGAKAHLFNRVEAAAGAKCYVNNVMDIALEEDAQLDHTELLLVPEESWFFETIHATLKQRSRLSALTVTTGAKTVRQDYRIKLMGEEAEATLRGLCLLKGRRQAHQYSTIEHKAPHCRSLQRFKGAIGDLCASSFEGKIHVHPEAQKTQAYQLNNYLLLGERALANSKPNLEIFADDVKASHGATISSLDPQQLFYLKTRGLSQADATRLLLQGFCKESVEEIRVESIQVHLAGAIDAYTQTT